MAIVTGKKVDAKDLSMTVELDSGETLNFKPMTVGPISIGTPVADMIDAMKYAMPPRSTEEQANQKFVFNMNALRAGKKTLMEAEKEYCEFTGKLRTNCRDCLSEMEKMMSPISVAIDDPFPPLTSQKLIDASKEIAASMGVPPSLISDAPKKKCQCGADSCGYADDTEFHSPWCPARVKPVEPKPIFSLTRRTHVQSALGWYGPTSPMAGGVANYKGTALSVSAFARAILVSEERIAELKTLPLPQWFHEACAVYGVNFEFK